MSFESSFRSEPTDVWTKCANNISQIGINTRDLNKEVGDLGTTRDTSALRERLREKRDATQKIVVATKEILQAPFEKQDKIKHERLAKQFNDALIEYEKVAKGSLQKEREIVRVRQASFNAQSNGRDVPEDVLQQLKELNISDVDEQIIKEQNNDIKQIETDLEELALCFVDIKEEILKQQTDLNNVEANTASAAVHVEDGRKDLTLAAKYAKRKRIKILIIILILLAVIAAIIIGAVVGTR